MTKIKQITSLDPSVIKIVRIWHKRLRERLLTALLAIQIFIIFVMPAARATGFQISNFIVHTILLAFIILATVLSRSRAAIGIMIIAVILEIFGIIWRHNQVDLTANVISAAGQVLTQLALLWIVTGAVFSPGRITYHRIMGAIVIYLSIGMIFTNLDILLARSISNSFSNLPTDNIGLREALTYFSFGALTTGNFGEIVPIHPIARSLANLESICGQLFPATLLARIVLRHSDNKNN